ncbi:FliI/YscN family ATPase [Thermaurantiacus sp.]
MIGATARLDALREAAAALAARAATLPLAAERLGRVSAFDGQLLVVEGLATSPGTLVAVETAASRLAFEVVGFREGQLLLMPLVPGPVEPGAVAVVDGRVDTVGVGPGLLGRVADALGRPADGRGPIPASATIPLDGRPLPTLARADVTSPIETGVRAIDGLLTLGRGQRIGLIAGSGVGKSTLMLDLVAGIESDVTVVALIGERGREIAAFVERLSPAARARTHVVAVPADHAAPNRVRGARRALAVAEHFRGQGAHVLLVLDSLTRVAHAQREVGIAAGEPVGTRGYPPSALSLLPRLIERAGNDSTTGGAITAIFTVLADADDLVADPVVDTARGVLDGHVVLSRALAARGRFPAIDPGQSVSRTMDACVTPDHRAAARAFVADSALIEANRDLVAMGAWVPGQDAALDRALGRAEAIEAFLTQPPGRPTPMAETLARLTETWGSAA